MSDAFTRQVAREALYRLSPATWALRALNTRLDEWQIKQVSAPAGARVICLVHRQAGKTTGGSVAVAHTMIYRSPGSTSLVLAPTQKQSAEFVRRLRENLLKAGQKLAVDNTFGIEIENGSRCLALPGQDDAGIRGLTISGGDLVIDEAARVDDRLYDAARPMLIRYARSARLILLSTAWTKDGFFYRVWSDGDEHDWTKIEASIDECSHIAPEDIERERRAMPATVFAREYMNQFDALESRFFSSDAIMAAFGGVVGPEPDEQDDDPIFVRRAVFNTKVFAEE
ncbi:hypothetical protein FHS77_001192 [Paenochrobactrum gallinarii]|uniref:Terminase n=2 Tax=Paenochrobactrum gallinarii TaxID=643673 RepID=A0A841M3D9_9HYPH|nr:hypothetical protein [Paenochrobactrum gallinarii]